METYEPPLFTVTENVLGDETILRLDTDPNWPAWNFAAERRVRTSDLVEYSSAMKELVDEYIEHTKTL